MSHSHVEVAQGDVRFHHIAPGLWALDARRCAHRWVVFHETYSMCLVEHVGPPEVVPWRYGHRTYTVDPRHRVMMMQPGELHANLDRSPTGDFVVIQIEESLMKSVAQALGWRAHSLNIQHPHQQTDDPAFVAELQRFQNGLCRTLYGSGSEAGRCTCFRSIDRHTENLSALVAAFLQQCAEGHRPIVLPERGSAPIRRAIEYLKEHFDEPYDLDRLALEAGCDRYYLCHVFKQELGASPGEFQNRILVAKTCEALAKSPTMPLELLAGAVNWPGRTAGHDGSAKASLIIRHFKRTLGVTPNQFRATLRAMSANERLCYANGADAILTRCAAS